MSAGRTHGNRRVDVLSALRRLQQARGTACGKSLWVITVAYMEQVYMSEAYER